MVTVESAPRLREVDLSEMLNVRPRAMVIYRAVCLARLDLPRDRIPLPSLP